MRILRLATRKAGMIMEAALLLALMANRGALAATLQGVVIDSSSLSPVPWAEITVVETHSSTLSDENGRFVFEQVAAGAYTVVARRIGFLPVTKSIRTNESDSAVTMIHMVQETLVTPPVTVTGSKENEPNFRGQQPLALSGKKLLNKLGGTIAETLKHEPGISQRSMGPAPARPVLRGMSGNRLLLLEDGGRAGDLSATSSDHAVVIDPILAESVEIIRGPASLIYGSNAVAGIVNLNKEVVPTSLPGQFGAEMSFQGESMNNGGTAAGKIHFPVKALSIQVVGTNRKSRDIKTPAGRLRNTGLSSSEAAFGASVVQPWGSIGFGGSWTRNDYGVPGGFLGGHPQGVDIELNRRHGEFRVHLVNDSRLLRTFDAALTVNRYYHRELESSGICGVSFGVLTYNLDLKLQLAQRRLLSNAVVGIWGEHRDYSAGCLSFVPATIERAAAAYMYNEQNLAGLLWQGSLRYDIRFVSPENQIYTKAGSIRGRQFGGVSAGLRASRYIGHDLSLAASLMQTFNSPGVEELFSDGPHLAAYSYEIGNADLNAERATGLDLALQFGSTHFTGQISIYSNVFANFIFPRDTGLLEYGPGENGFLARYQYAGHPATVSGTEVSGTLRFSEAVSSEITLSYVRGTLSDDDRPLPFIPPLSGQSILTWQYNSLALTGGLQFALRQDRLGDFEQTTQGYVTASASLQYGFGWNGSLHTLVISGENLLDTAYRNHLSRVKSIMPEPGRSLKLSYKMYL